MKAVVIQFPGSNCDQDAFAALKIAEGNPTFVWHTESELPKDTDLVFVPGGFSYGDYLRSGAIAALSPIMSAVKKYASAGGLVIGVCNGFQILTESGLLEGVLKRNKDLYFECQTLKLTVENNNTAFTADYQKNQIIDIPIAHGEGFYYADEATIDELEKSGRVVFRYQKNPNGSLNNIAGIINKQGNVLGMMPHPERAVEALLGSTDGLGIFSSIKKYLVSREKK